MRFWFSKITWGTFLLLAAAMILFNQFGCAGRFANVGIGGVIVAVLSLAVIVECAVRLRFAPLPIPLAALYITFQAPLGLPHIKIWALVAASLLAFTGLGILLPSKHRRNRWKHKNYDPLNAKHAKIPVEDDGGDNNPSVSVNFGAIGRRLRADSLETVRLSCNFGAMQIFFDRTEPSPGGAEAILNCSFGSMELFIPKHWRVVDKLSCTLGSVGIDNAFAASDRNAPKLTLTGSVSLGSVEVR
jgi:hypothetical protein